MKGMCKRPTCDLLHVTKADAKKMTRDAIMQPITQPEVPTEPQPDFETRDTNRLPTYDEPEMFFTIFDSIE